MRKPGWLIAAIMLLLASASACNGDAEVQVPGTTEEPSPTASPSFQLQGRVIEASGSAKGPQASPSPDATPTTPTGSPEATEQEGQTQPEETAIEQAAPGSLALRLTSYSGQDTGCVFGEGDTIVVLYSRASTFQPGDVTGNDRFPNNLVNEVATIEGQVLDEEGCILVASSISLGDEAQPSPTAGAGTDRTSPTPQRRATPTPARTPTPTTPAAEPTPEAPADEGTPETPDETTEP